MELALDQVAKCLGLSLPSGVATGWSIDTRTLAPGDVVLRIERC